MHRVVHHVGPPFIYFETALLAAGQVVHLGRGAVGREVEVPGVQHQIGKVQVVVVEGRQAGFLPGLIKVVEGHIEPADVGLVEVHAPPQRLSGGFLGGFIKLADGFGGVHYPLLHRHGLVLSVGEAGVF